MIGSFAARFGILLSHLHASWPWQVTEALEHIIKEIQDKLPGEYQIQNGIAVHQSAVIEQNVVIKAPVIIGAKSFVGANVYLRGPVFIDEEVKIGAGCEIKQSLIFSSSAIAHFNYIGNSIVGSRVNFEAGSVAANHYNERTDKFISVRYNDEVIATGVTKFGALVGDDCRIGANAVLSPGTLLPPGTVVGRLQLVKSEG